MVKKSLAEIKFSLQKSIFSHPRQNFSFSTSKFSPSKSEFSPSKYKFSHSKSNFSNPKFEFSAPKNNFRMNSLVFTTHYQGQWFGTQNSQNSIEKNYRYVVEQSCSKNVYRFSTCQLGQHQVVLFDLRPCCRIELCCSKASLGRRFFRFRSTFSL